MESGIKERVRCMSSKIKGDGDRSRLESELSAVDGAREIEVDPDGHAVEINFDPTIVDANSIRRAVEDAGYSVES